MTVKRRLQKALFGDVMCWERYAQRINDEHERTTLLAMLSIFRSNRVVALIMAPTMLVVALTGLILLCLR